MTRDELLRQEMVELRARYPLVASDLEEMAEKAPIVMSPISDDARRAWVYWRKQVEDIQRMPNPYSATL